MHLTRSATPYNRQEWICAWVYQHGGTVRNAAECWLLDLYQAWSRYVITLTPEQVEKYFSKK